MSELLKDLKDLQSRIKAFKRKQTRVPQKVSVVSHYNLAVQVVVDFIAPIFVGICIGYVIDAFFNTLPLFMIIFIFLGFLAGLLNIYKTYVYIDNDNQE